MMKRIIISLFVLIVGNGAFAQQDALYSQYMQNPVLINPAYSGTYNMMSATFMSRVQWVGLEGAPTTNSLSAHTAFANNRLGGGVILVNDRFGINNNTEAHGTLAYKLRLSDDDDHALSFGMQASMVNYNYNYSNVKLKDGGDESFISGNKVATEPNFGAGVFYRNEKFFAGLSAPKILNSEFADGNLSVGQYRRHFFATAGYLVDMTSVQFKPSLLIRYVEGAPVSADINASFLLKDKIWLGASLRKLNTAVLMAQFQLNDMFRLGYSVDLPMNNLIKASYGSHEIMLNMDLKLLQSHDIGLRYF